MNLQTYVHIPKASFDISHRSAMLLLGSCFSENMGKKLLENKFSVQVNPFGILYNPHSISKAINRLLNKDLFSEKDFVLYDSMYHSFMHHGSFSKIKLSDAIKNANDDFKKASAQLQRADLFLITFGTSYVFKWKESGKVVGNCHKIPAYKFERERLSPEEIFSTWSNLISRIIALNPHLKLIFTVSPIRHFKDGAHQNQLSKAILHLSIDSLMNKFPENAFYFPSYEIIMDQLRDYRFYTDNMLHPTTLAQNYIWERFEETYFSDETLQINKEWGEIRHSLTHKPYNPNSDAYQQFLRRTFDELEAFEERYTFLSCFDEKQKLTQLLKNTF